MSVEFFDLLHAPTGWRCLFTLPDRKHYWFQNSSALVAAALALDAKGLAVFHSCATFTRKTRKQQYVAGLQCYWFDLDAGAGKPYRDAHDAYRALEEWRGRVTLPPVCVVVSGGGLHAYWPLRVALGIERWRIGADRLRALALEHGLHIDPSSTIDAARVLRPPGTHNRKLLDAAGKKLADVGGPAREVKRGPLVGPYDLVELFGEEVMRHNALSVVRANPPSQSALPGRDNASPLAHGLGAVPSYLQGVKDAGGALTIRQDDDTPSDPRVVAARCPQFQDLLAAVAQKNDPAIGWYPFLGVLAFCGAAGHEYARSLATEPHWVPTIDKKLAQWQEKADGPTTCAKFGQLNAGPCILCPYSGKITSPIQLGRALPAATTAPAPPKLELPLLPKGFRWAGQRLVVERKPTDEDPSDCHIISEYPIVVGELQETERSKRVSLVYRSWEPMTQSWRDFTLNMGELVGQGGPGKVADHGVVIPKKRWDQFVLYTQAVANDCRGTRAYGVRYEQFGWKREGDTPAFVLGEHLLRPGAPPVSVHGSDEVARRGALMAPQGDARSWTAAADALVAGLPGHAFMLLCAFAAPLYYFTGEPGVTFVHGATRSSGQGKTAILEAGASVMGHPDATSVIERDTMVAKFVTLGTLCHLPVFFDELRFRDPEDTKHYVLQGTLGRDKQRGRAEGGLRADQLNWATLHVSASNLSLVDTVRHDGAEVAQAARIFEFSLALPEGARTTDGDALKRVLRANAGTAGRAFVQAALNHYDWVAATVPARMRFYEEQLQAGPDERFVLRLLACVDVAGALARKYDLLHVDLAAVLAWAVAVQRGSAERTHAEAAPDAGAVLSQMVNDLAPHTLVMPRAQTIGAPLQTQVPIREPRGELRARLEVMGRKLLLDVAAVRKWMQAHQYSFTETQKELIALGVLKADRVRRSLAAGSTFGIGQTWCWQIDGTHALLTDLIDAVAAPSNVVPLRAAP